MAADGDGQAIVYEEHFEDGTGGYTADNTGGTLLGLWHYSLGRHEDGLSNHSPNHNWYYGRFETSTGGGRYDGLPFDHQGTLTSPLIDLPDDCSLELQFSYFLDTREPLDVDFAEVHVITVSGGEEAVTIILSRADGTLPETGSQWLVPSYDLTSFAGETIKLRFFFDTGDVPLVDPEGWYVDDVVITSVCPAADLSVMKQVDDATPDEGQEITYTITAANSAASNAAATGVTVFDSLPDGVTLVSAAASEGQYDEAADIWSGLELAPGETATLTITVIVNQGTAGQTLVNTAVISGGETDPDESNNQDTVEVTPQLVTVTDTIQFITPLSVFRPDGGFSYSPFRRPADTPEDDPDHPYLGNWTTHTDEATLLAVLEPWQLVTVGNQTGAAFKITDVITVAAGSGADYVAVTDENLQPLALPIVVPAGEEVRLWAFYSPQEPDWSVAPYRPAHTFARDDHLEIVTDLDGGREFHVRLVGASTYDADITYDGVVDGADAVLVNELLGEDKHWPIVPGEPAWDPTADINVKFRNAADSSPAPPTGADKWPEIGLGDVGPLNVEFDAVRPPLLDLDWDNSSGIRGVDYLAEYQVGGDPLAVVDSDARFANSPFLFLASVMVTVTNVQGGDVLAADTTGTNVVASYDGQSGVLTLAPDPAAPIPKATVAEFETVLRSIRYSSQADAPNDTPRVIELQAFGDEDQFGQQQTGNVAVTTVNIELSASWAASAAVSEETPAASPTVAATVSAFSFSSSAAVEAVAETAAANGAASLAAVDAVMDSSQTNTVSTAPQEPLLSDDLLASLALFMQDDGQEEEELLPPNTPPIDLEVLFN